MSVESAARPSQQHVHQHGPQCYWDLRECRWVCASERRSEHDEPPLPA